MTTAPEIHHRVLLGAEVRASKAPNSRRCGPQVIRAPERFVPGRLRCGALGAVLDLRRDMMLQLLDAVCVACKFTAG